MKKSKLVSRFVVLALTISAFALSSASAPRKSPEFTIYESSGRTTLLSNFKGKVVVLEFLFIKSEHCLRVARTLNKLHAELGQRGFQPVGITFDPPSSPNTGGQFVSFVVDDLRLTYPVGYSAKADVDRFLGRTRKEILNIPQIVVIDRTGMIRATSGGAGGDPKLEDENSLRNLIDSLLKEGGPVASTKK
jgi:peroxiredoxin